MNDVKFNLKNPKKETTLVVMVYRYNGRRIVISTGITISTNHWNPKKQRVREVSGYFEYPAYNNTLNKFDDSVKKAITSFSNKGINPTHLKLKEKIKEYANGGGNDNSKYLTVVKYTEDFISKSKTSGIRSAGTIAGFKQLVNVLKSYKDGRSLEFQDLNLEKLNGLTKHMVTKYKYGSGQINKIQRKLITVSREAEVNGYKLNRAFKSANWRVSPPKINDKGIAFTLDEIEAIKKAEVSDRLDRVRDRFLLGVSVGQRYSDFQNISINDIVTKNGKEYFNIVQQKTGKVIKIPVNKLMKEILTKYEGNPPSISPQKFNDYLKELCQEADIIEEVIVRKENPIDGIISEERVPKYKLTSSHDCRRTFATLAHLKGVPAAIIMKITGHSNLRTFSNYIRVNLEDNDSIGDQLDII